MAYERLWPAVTQPFSSDGTAQATFKVADFTGFFVKQAISLKSNTLPDPLPLEIKRIDPDGTIHVGAPGNIDARTPIPQFLVSDAATVTANEQRIGPIKPDEIINAVYERDPVKAVRVELIDKTGNPYDHVVDSSGKNRLAVDGQFHAEVDVQVDVDVDGFYDAATNPDPDNIGLIGHTRSNPTNQTHQVQRQTAKRGTVNTDTVSADVSIHDHSGNEYTSLNPVPVTTNYEKFFSLIAASQWMKLANYDQVIPTFAGADLTLTYKEGAALLGIAVITNYASLNGWSLQLSRYIDDDDGTPLQDDDGSFLNLD